MNDIGKEYGAAIFMLACEKNAKNEYADSLKKLKIVFDENPEYESFLSSPSIALGERLKAIEAAFSDAVEPDVLSYLQLMCEKGRICCFLSSVEEYMALLDASMRISNAKVRSAVELTEDEKQRLKSKLEKIYEGEVNLEYAVDKSLLGGLVVEVDGKIMDGSLRHRLRDVKEVMSV